MLSLEAKASGTRCPPDNGVSLLRTRAAVGRHRSAASWHFACNHMTDIATVDMFVVATVTSKLLDAVTGISHHRRRFIHFEVTRNPTQIWLARRSTEAFLGTPPPAICCETAPAAEGADGGALRSSRCVAIDILHYVQPSCMDSNSLSPIRWHFSLGSLVSCYLKQLPHQTQGSGRHCAAWPLLNVSRPKIFPPECGNSQSKPEHTNVVYSTCRPEERNRKPFFPSPHSANVLASS